MKNNKEMTIQQILDLEKPKKKFTSKSLNIYQNENGKYSLIGYYLATNKILKKFELEHYQLSNLEKILINPKKLLKLIKSNKSNYFAVNRELEKIRDARRKNLSFLKNPKGYENLSNSQKSIFVSLNIYQEIERKNKKIIDTILLWDNLDYEEYKTKSDEEKEKYIKNLSLYELEFLFDI
jgi:hypothetical protein